MLDIAIMIEGQNGLNWARWQRIARAVEDLGFAGLYRSDHYTNADPPDIDSLECWTALTWLATNTRRIDFGPLVSPVSFRQPTMLARMAAAVGELSGGRLTLGVGAGWQAREHANYGWELLDAPRRFKRFVEGVQIIAHLVRRAEPLNFEGEFYRLKEAVLLPRPTSPLPILIGGNGPKQTLPLAARYADEWNATFQTPEGYARLNRGMDELLAQNGRQPADLRRSMMTGCFFGKDAASLKGKLDETKETAESLRAHGIVFGSSSEVTDHLGKLAEAGLQRIMLQWLDLDDLDGLETLARDVLPAFKK